MTVITFPQRANPGALNGSAVRFGTGGPKRVAFFGDSITMSAGQVALYGFNISSTVNGFTSTSWAILWADPETPAGSGSWAYNATTKMATWAAPGESAGAAVDFSRSGVYYLPSSVAGHGLTVVWDGTNRTYGTGTTTVTVPADGLQYQALFSSRGFPVCVMQQCGPAWDFARAPSTVYPYLIAVGGMPGFGSAALAASTWQAASIQADVDIIEIGTNDIAASVSAATIIANLTTFIASRVQAGTYRIGVLTIPPRTANTATMNKVRAQVNRWIRDYASANVGVTCLDVSAAVSDPSTGGWISGYSGDGVHPSNLGAWAMAKVVSTWLLSLSAANSWRPGYEDLWHATDNPYGALIPTAGYLSFEGTGGTAGAGASGTVPANYSLARSLGSNITGAGAKVARTDNVGGNWYEVTLANATTDEYMELAPVFNPQNLSTYGLSAGDNIEAIVEVNVVSSTSLKFLDMRISFGGVTSGSRMIRANTDTIVGGNAVLTDSPGVLWLRTPPATIPVGATTFSPIFRLGTGASGAAVIRLGRWSLNKVRTV